MKRLLTICLVAGFILTATSPATADDVLPPPWAGQGLQRTVHARWDSWIPIPHPNDLMWSPDYCISTPDVSFDPFATATYAHCESVYMSRNDVMLMGSSNDLTFWMPNFGESEENSYKKVWMQVTFHQANSDLYPNFYVTGEGIDYMTNLVFEDEVFWEASWVTQAYSFEIWPNPESELIVLNFEDAMGTPNPYPAYVDQVVIDTWCVPEPTTICLLGLGSVVLLRKRRA